MNFKLWIFFGVFLTFFVYTPSLLNAACQGQYKPRKRDFSPSAVKRRPAFTRPTSKVSRYQSPNSKRLIFLQTRHRQILQKIEFCEKRLRRNKMDPLRKEFLLRRLRFLRGRLNLGSLSTNEKNWNSIFSTIHTELLKIDRALHFEVAQTRGGKHFS